MIPNPNHETKLSGKMASKHSRNSVYSGRSWTRHGRGRKRPTTVTRKILNLSRSQIIHHCNTMAPEDSAEAPVCSEVVSIHSALPLDYNARIEGISVHKELKALIEHALSCHRQPRMKRRTVVKGGIIHTVTEELPSRKLETLEDFIEAFPSMREVLTRLATLNQA